MANKVVYKYALRTTDEQQIEMPYGAKVLLVAVQADDVVIEHLHPQAGGKAEWDDGYRRVNSAEMWAADAAAWEQYQVDGRLAADVEKIRALL